MFSLDFSLARSEVTGGSAGVEGVIGESHDAVVAGEVQLL